MYSLQTMRRSRNPGKIDPRIKGIIAPTTDEYFNNVALLLHMDGINGSTVFTDVKGKTVTPFGNAQINTAQSKFGGASGYFDGSGDYLLIPLSTDLEFGSVDFTWEGLIRPATVTPSITMTVFGNAKGGQAGNSGLFLVINNSRFLFRHWINGNSPATSSQTIQPNTWYHVACTKVGADLKIFVEGIIGTSGSTSLSNQDSAFTIGTTLENSGFATDFIGYIDEVRLSKGISRYTSDFVLPDSPFPNS